MPATYQPIATTTLGSAAADITFTSIPGTYTDLIIQGSAGSTSSTLNRGIRIQFNADTANNYSFTSLYGEASAGYSYRSSNVGYINAAEAIGYSSDWSAVTIHIPNYSNTTTNKSILGRGGTKDQVSADVGLWRSTAAITSIKLFLNADSFRSGTTLTLYGIKAG
jgi:hypothetical protein